MKFWEKLSSSIYRLAGEAFGNKFRRRTLESTLSGSLRLLNPEMVAEMRTWLQSQQTPQGGFANRAAKCDLYYSFFGLFVAEALSIKEVYPALKQYVKKVANEEDLQGVNLFCCVILYAKLFGSSAVPKKLKQQLSALLKTNPDKSPEYVGFMGILSLYYLNDFWGMFRLAKRYNRSVPKREMPCPVLAATLVLMKTTGRNTDEITHKLWSYYRNNGGFAALQQTPTEDLLSTAVALFALTYANADLRPIKPFCLAFIDNLYMDGGFCATQYDTQPDVEYTFYGLLGLGAMEG